MPTNKNQFAPPNVRALVADQGRTVCQKYGPRIEWRELLTLLEDRACVHFPCEVKFDAEVFGSLALGLSRDEYFSTLCELSGQLGGDELI